MTMAQKYFENNWRVAGFEFPALRDPRWHILAFQMCYVVYETMWPGFAKGWMHFGAAFVACFGTDLLLAKIYQKADYFPLSGVISSVGTFLLTDSLALWPFMVIGSGAMLAKHFVRINGRHVFNPTNFSIVILMALTGREFGTAAGRWGSEGIFAIAMSLIGAWIAFRANRIVLAGSFVTTFAAGAYIRSSILGTNPLVTIGPMTGAAFQLFLFYMITDPATTPKRWRGQLLFGVSLGICDAWFRYMANRNAVFYSLFLVTAAYSLFLWQKTNDREPGLPAGATVVRA